jgi:hypothetical protein
LKIAPAGDRLPHIPKGAVGNAKNTQTHPM